jgi:hypothetical protein
MPAASLASFLKARRADCNARFAMARRRWPRLDGDDFTRFLTDQVPPLADALTKSAPGSEPAVLERAYELGLQLVGEKLAGPAAGSPAINALWTGVFPPLAGLVATAPRRLLGSLCNAAHQLSGTPDTRPDAWRAGLATLGPRCTDAEQLLALAALLAWRAGLAHLRTAALSGADALPAELALAALEAPPGTGWPEARDAHLDDPWFAYPAARLEARRIGAFRGFGGCFAVPPHVTRSGSHLLLLSGDEAWILVADAFGATFHRAAPEEIEQARPVTTGGRSGLLPAGHVMTSGVVIEKTVAVTSARSHAVWIGPARAIPQ